MKNRKTLDDLAQEPEQNWIEQDRKGRPRVIKRRPEPLPEMYENERELKKAAADLLEKLPRCRLIKTDNSGLVIKGRMRAKSREPGMSDQHLCIFGRFVALEAKMPGKDLEKDQLAYRDSILAADGTFIVYHSLRELITELKRLRLLSRRFEL